MRSFLGLGLFSPECVNNRKKGCVRIQIDVFYGVLSTGSVLGDGHACRTACSQQSSRVLSATCCYPARCNRAIPSRLRWQKRQSPVSRCCISCRAGTPRSPAQPRQGSPQQSLAQACKGKDFGGGERNLPLSSNPALGSCLEEGWEGRVLPAWRPSLPGRMGVSAPCTHPCPEPLCSLCPDDTHLLQAASLG